MVMQIRKPEKEGTSFRDLGSSEKKNSEKDLSKIEGLLKGSRK